jgi:hypothetical protein
MQLGTIPTTRCVFAVVEVGSKEVINVQESKRLKLVQRPKLLELINSIKT